jgi:predicted acylesterase/phospholipase RssA
MTKTRYFQNCLGVFQGGGCKASAYVGAYKEAANWGVSFSELVGTSAGSIIAAFIAAGATPDDLESIISELDFKKFLSSPTEITNYKPPFGSKALKYIPIKEFKKYHPIITHLGLYNSDKLRKWVDDKLAQLLPNIRRPIKFKDLIIPVHVIVSDIKTKNVEVFGQAESANMDVALAVQYSCNIPIFFQPIELRYVDGGILSNLPSFIFTKNAKNYFNKVLAFSLESEEENNEIDSIVNYGKALLNTAIDGNLELQLSLQENVHIIKVNTGKIRATDFNTINADDIKLLKINAQNAVKNFFTNEISNIKNARNNQDVLLDSFQTNTKITQLLEKNYEEIVIVDDDNQWVYEIFPSLLKWYYDKSKILFITNSSKKGEKHYDFRNRFLQHSGVQIEIVEHLPFKGFIFDGNLREYCRAIILNDNEHFHSKYYEGETDFNVINLMRNQFINLKNENGFIKPTIEMVEDEVLIREIRNVYQYNKPSVNLSMQELNVSDLTFLNKYIRAYKFRQIETIFSSFLKSGIDYFSSAKLILKDDKYTLITPPVVEKTGDKYYVIEGNTRLLFAYKNGIRKVNCIVVNGVTDPLPTDGRYNVKEVILSDKELIGDERYENFDYSNFRKIESSVRNPEKCLK